MDSMDGGIWNFRYDRVWNVGNLTSTVTCLPPFSRIIQHFKDFSSEKIIFGSNRQTTGDEEEGKENKKERN